MTVKEMMAILATMDENAEVAFVTSGTDRDGIMYQGKRTDYVGITTADAEPIKRVCGNPIYVK